jgi:hypothetical protein
LQKGGFQTAYENFLLDHGCWAVQGQEGVAIALLKRHELV